MSCIGIKLQNKYEWEPKKNESFGNVQNKNISVLHNLLIWSSTEKATEVTVESSVEVLKNIF